MTTNNKISNLVYSQVPFFVKNDHPNFIFFLEKYYEYLEQTGGVVDRAKNLPSFTDIDITEDFFADILYSQFINFLPRSIMADKSLVLKYAKDFYRAKGTEKSIRFLLNILFGINVTEFYYPKNDILRASDGKWFIQKSLKINEVFVDSIATTDLKEIEKFTSRQITGLTSGATAIVESVTSYYDAGSIVYEFTISNVVKEFASSESITANFEENGVFKTITANTFGGIVNSVKILSGGAGYTLGTFIPVESNTGNGASVVISGITKGNISGIAIEYSGAGFTNGNFVLVTGGGTGSGANADILVMPDGQYHPNSYTVVSSTIELEANTTIGNVIYSNLSSANVNTSIIGAVDTFVYGNTGPVNRVFVLDPGEGYSSLPSLDIQSNTRIRTLGILGRMEIVDGGSDYQIGDTIEFINPPFCYGTGAQAEVSNVDANGAITEVQFVQLPGHFVGGAGYTNQALPLANVISANGTNANVIVKTILGDGETLVASTETIGRITEVTILSGGRGYETAPTLNLKNTGDGTAQVTAEIITGAFTYPGRFINDDGMISSFNYLEDRDYYQNFSYVIRTNSPFALYKKAIYDLVHPTGMKVFGEFDFINDDITRFAKGVTTETKTGRLVQRLADYYTVGDANGSTIYINIPSHGFNVNDNVYVDFITGSATNIANIDIVSAGSDYKSGFIIIEGGSGSGANASILTGSSGEITKIVINDEGQTYTTTDTFFANVDHLITSNVATITINSGSEGYANGFIRFEGGSGRNANANISVNATGAIVGVTILNRGTGYEANDVIVANVASQVTFNLANIIIGSGGTAYSNGFINFIGGSGFGANANVSVDAQGNIVSVKINSRGYGYGQNSQTELLASVAHLKTYIIGELQLRNAGGNYSNGYITIEGGAGTLANAEIVINPQNGEINQVILNANGSGYQYEDSVYANVEHLITNNIKTVNINSGGTGYSNGYIILEGGSGINANASVTVNATGTIDNVIINSSGTSYASGDSIYANVEHLLTYRINTLTIANSGYSFSNGYVIFEGGSGRNANANISVNSTGAIVSVSLNNTGIDYKQGETVNVRVGHLMTYNVANVILLNRGRNYSNGYVKFEGGSGRNANARVFVNATGAIVNITMQANGTGYILSELNDRTYNIGNVNTVFTAFSSNTIIANVAHLGGQNANTHLVVFQYGDPNSGDLTASIIRYGNTANLGVETQRGAGNANITVVLSPNSATASLLTTLQKFTSNANLSVSLQKGAGGANLAVNMQPEPLNTITDDILMINTANTNWIEVHHPNTANIYGTSYAGILI